MRSVPIAVIALGMLSMTSCVVENRSCTPTTTDARSADKVDVGVLSRSSVIVAKLTAASGPLGGHKLTFEVLDDDASVYTADATTSRDGTARVDLKRADPDAVLAIVRADAFRASFSGDATYCSSNDRAGFHAVRG